MAETCQSCELCNKEATVYCPSDSAFLCYTCDSKVHSANFLVARHIRSSICELCRNIDGHRFSGARFSPPARFSCRSCSPENDGVTHSSSSSSSCVSSTTEVGHEVVSKRREKVAIAVDLKVEGILVNWCRRMAMDDRKMREIVRTTVEILGGGLERMTILPFRVAVTASFWVALRLYCGGDTCQDLRRVEQISGVPQKMILAVESRLARVLKRRRSREDHAEGWAEC